MVLPHNFDYFLPGAALPNFVPRLLYYSSQGSIFFLRGGEGGSRNGGMVIGSALEHKSFPRKPFYDLSFTVCAINAWRVSFLKRHLGAPYKSVDYRSSFCQT